MRLSLARGIVARLMPRNEAGLPQSAPQKLHAVTLDPAFEKQLRDALVMRSDGPVLALAPQAVQAASDALVAAFEQAAATSSTMVVALPGDIRRAASRLFRGGLPRAAFLSHEELGAAGVPVVSVAQAK